MEARMIISNASWLAKPKQQATGSGKRRPDAHSKGPEHGNWGVALALLLAASTSLAATQVTGHVQAVSINKNFGTFVFVQLDAPQTSPIPCQTNLGWTYTLPQQSDTDKKILALLMMAKATGQQVTLYGSGSCSDFAAVESAIGIETQ
jgi:hypothetical protein